MNLVRSRFFAFSIAVFSILVAGLVDPARANYVREMSLEEKVRDSDVVMIARVETTLEKCERKSSCATVHVLKQLKGTVAPGLRVLYNGYIAEDNPLCCKVGETYLFFLKNVGENLYLSINGPYGIYVIQAETDRDLTH
ncbi:hypothetical protein [Dyella sp. 2HG41-7]|uniref:hypothetical protein n=1 Tax=Dyella sp. 2HG41-7 TaxID=2883239 RepID=UPI001F179B1E|nr:hypothetical protein [Dyella sp. 2HG41-7]